MTSEMDQRSGAGRYRQVDSSSLSSHLRASSTVSTISEAVSETGMVKVGGLLD